MRYAQVTLLLTSIACGCHRSQGGADPEPTPRSPSAPSHATAPPLSDASPDATAPTGADASLASPHRVVFADRTSQGYLLLVSEAQTRSFSREDLLALVERELDEPSQEAEAQRLLELVATEPLVEDPKLVGQHAAPLGSPRATTELLGLHLEHRPLRREGKELIGTQQLLDPLLTRALAPAERASLPTRQHVLLLRADYRNRHALLGLRLLQHLVELVARDRDALIHDPDTLETMGPDVFSQRRLRPSLSNVADQIVIVPFADSRHAGAKVRLATRGMRRFGSVDLELDGLPREPSTLQAASDLLNGLAFQMVQLGEFDSTGYAVELPQVVTIEQADVERAYGRSEPASPRCASCPGEVDVHLVERPTEPHDPSDHVVARVVAPRPESDAPSYDQSRWVQQALTELFGPSSG